MTGCRIPGIVSASSSDGQIDALPPLSKQRRDAIGFTEYSPTGVAGTAPAEYNG